MAPVAPDPAMASAQSSAGPGSAGRGQPRTRRRRASAEGAAGAGRYGGTATTIDAHIAVGSLLGASACNSVGLGGSQRPVTGDGALGCTGKDLGELGEQGGGRRGHFRPYHATRVPKRTNLNNTFPTSCCPEEPVTTVMLRNIPNKYAQASLLKEIDQMGFDGTYDFFYLPMDVHNRTNVGYAFVNFLAPPDALRFSRSFINYKFQKHPSQKIATVSPAHIQGLAKNLYHFSNRAVAQSKDSQYRPVVIINGVYRDCQEALAELTAAPTEPPLPSFVRSRDIPVLPFPMKVALHSTAGASVLGAGAAPDGARGPEDTSLGQVAWQPSGAPPAGMIVAAPPGLTPALGAPSPGSKLHGDGGWRPGPCSSGDKRGLPPLPAWFNESSAGSGASHFQAGVQDHAGAGGQLLQ